MRPFNLYMDKKTKDNPSKINTLNYDFIQHKQNEIRFFIIVKQSNLYEGWGKVVKKKRIPFSITKQNYKDRNKSTNLPGAEVYKKESKHKNEKRGKKRKIVSFRI